MFFRNMMADLFGRSAYSKKPGSFISFFQYKIGHNQPEDYHLYFPSEPYALKYYNEIFNKLFTFNPFDIVAYLEFHYAAYSNKYDFLRFLQYEINDRLKQSTKKVNRPKLESAKEWVTEKQQELQKSQQAELRQEPQEEPLLTRKEIAGIFRISLVTLHGWMKRGLPSHKQGGRVYFLSSEA